VIQLERAAEREILAAVRREMDSLFGQRDVPTAPDEERLAELVRVEIARWQRARVNSNLTVLPDVAAMEERVMNWLVRLGPLEPLIRNPAYEEIFVDSPREVGVIERTGRTVMLPDVYFDNDEEVRELTKRALAAVGRRVDEASPMVDARLADGSRLNVVIPPVSQQHTVLTIRTFRPDVDTLERLVELGTITHELGLFLRAAVRAYLNIVVSGPTGSGKTTLPNALGNETDGTGRMIVIEQTRELKLPDLVPLCVSLEAQEENAEGVGEIEQRELVRVALRMRPRRIIVGETRGAETWDMLRAMNTGHGGCLSSVHANSPRDALDALITLGMMAPERPPESVMARLIARSISLVIQMAEEPGTGRRLLTHVFEITGLEASMIQGHDLWLRDELSGRLEWTCTPPKCMAEFARKGVPYAVPSAPVLGRTNGVLA
jgi:pilus assembly protein CpaF